MKRTLRVGIVGCGKMARIHLMTYQGAKGVEIASVCDLNPDAAAAFAKETGARVAASPADMARSDGLDAVTVVTPPGTHLENCRPLLKAGVAVYCEKPLEVDAKAAGRLAALAKRTEAVFMVGFNHRFHAPIVELKKLIGKGALGKPLLFRNIFASYMPVAGDHRCNRALSGGGTLIDNCSHSVDLFRFLMGEPTHVQTMGGNVMQDVAIEDFGMMHLRTADGAFGEITSSYSLPGAGNWVELYGTKGMATVSYWNPGHPDLAYRLNGKDWRPVDCSKHSPNMYATAIENFLKAVRTGKTPPITAEDGLKANRVTTAAYKSLAESRQVRIG